MEVAYKKTGKNRYEIEKTPEMKAEARFYASEEILPLVTRDKSLLQLQQTAKLPHLVSPVLGMPDMHQGYGIPVGGVMASEKIVSAGCVGMDINCGVRLLRCGIEYNEKIFDERGLKELVSLIEEHIPMGLGGQKKKKHEGVVLKRAITEGARHLVEAGYGEERDLEYCEEEGRIDGAKPDNFFQKSLDRAQKQIGSLGSGNHFLELQVVEKIFDDDIARTFGLKKNLICFMIHSGSRALGHQSCIDYTNKFEELNSKRNPELVPVKNLASSFVNSKSGKDYLSVMYGAINFAFANRHMMAHQFRKIFTEYIKDRGENAKVELVYDVAHNSAKWEKHGGKEVLVHRKGATRALPQGHPDNPKAYKDTGHPAFVPGSMGTPSYVLVGTEKAAETFYSVNHGAGRAMSRTEAKNRFSKKEIEEQMKGVVLNKPHKVVADEAPEAYKDVEAVIDVLADIGLTKKVAKLRPLAVLKGD